MNIADIGEIVRKVLKEIEMGSPAAHALIMGTGAVESKYEYLRQLGGGPARSWWQVEPETAKDNWLNYLKFRSNRWAKIQAACSVPSNVFIESVYDISWVLEHNIAFAVAMCRIVYWRYPKPLPAENDVEAMGRYWKAAYNTDSGKGTVEKYIEAQIIL